MKIGTLIKRLSTEILRTRNASRKVCYLAFALGCLFLLANGTVRAQNTADVVGTVTDASGGILPGATVTITNTGTNISQTTQTTSGGEYVFNLLQVGTYTVRWKRRDSRPFPAASIALSSGDRARVDAKMEVGDVTQTVEVQASAAPALQTDTSTIGTLVTSQAWKTCLSMDATSLNWFNSPQAPRKVRRVRSQRATARTTAARRRHFPRTGKATPEQNMIDGFDNNERIVGTIGARPSIDAIQEVNVSTNKYDASVGRTGGARGGHYHQGRHEQLSRLGV